MNNDWKQYHERTSHPTEAEKLDARNYRIESETDYDVLNWDSLTVDVIDRTASDGETHTIDIYRKSTEEIITLIEKL